MPRLSIITINYNNLEGLQRTIESVGGQTFTDFEYIIIDGGSTDGSVALIKTVSNKLSYWVSEKDKGIYNAMNKGIANAKGEYFIFLNSGDTFYDSRLLEHMVPYLNNQGIVYGNLMIKEQIKSWVKKYDQPISFDYFTRDTLPHQGAFIYKELFKVVGSYNESGILCADWQFFLEAVCRYGSKVKYVDRVISVYDYTGISSRPENAKIILQEKEVILQREWGYVQSMHNQLVAITRQYNLLANSKFVKAYLALRKKMGKY